MGGAYHDSQRQLASAARALETGKVSNEEAEAYALIGTLNEGVPPAPYVPRAVVHQTSHRDKYPSDNIQIYPACVPRKVSKGEWKKQTTQEAFENEWNRLRNMPWPNGKGKGTWDESKVRNASEVRAEATKSNKTVHFSRICELLYEKGSELNEGDPLRKSKGRAVLLGNNIFDQKFDWAEFQELSSAPPSMEAARACDALGLFPGYTQKRSDAISAYTQAFLKAPTT